MMAQRVMIIADLGQQRVIQPQAIMGSAVRRHRLRMAHLHRFHRMIEIVIEQQRNLAGALRVRPLPAHPRLAIVRRRQPAVGVAFRPQFTVEQIVAVPQPQRCCQTKRDQDLIGARRGSQKSNSSTP